MTRPVPSTSHQFTVIRDRVDTVVTTFQALGVALLALLPGASYTFAYERIVGKFGATLADRLVRFLAASAAFMAILSGPGLLIYRHVIVPGRLAHGDVNWLEFEVCAVAYVLIPTVAGTIVGHGYRNNWKALRWFTSTHVEPKAWDYLWTRGSVGVVRLRTKTGIWLGGTFGTVNDVESFAGSYPEDGDLYLSQQLQIDPISGEWTTDPQDIVLPVVPQTGLLLAAIPAPNRSLNSPRCPKGQRPARNPLEHPVDHLVGSSSHCVPLRQPAVWVVVRLARQVPANWALAGTCLSCRGQATSPAAADPTRRPTSRPGCSSGLAESPTPSRRWLCWFVRTFSPLPIYSHLTSV